MLVMRRVYGWLAAGLIAFAFYGSVLPFRFRRQPLDGAWSAFLAILANPAPEYFSRTNFLANALLFVPVGFALMGARFADRTRGWSSIGITAVAVLALSLAASTLAEFLQIFAPGRVPALSDIVAQTAGCAIGIAVWIGAGSRLSGWLRESVDRHRDDRFARALVVYGALWIFAGLAPFDISVDIGLIARRFRTGMITLVPFGSPAPIGRQIWDAVASTLTTIPLGMLALVVGRPTGTRRGAGLAWLLGAAGIAALEAAQIFVRSHAADVTDLLFGWVGLAIGVAAGVRIFGRTATPHSAPGRRQSFAIVLTCVWALVVCGYHWQPFDVSVDQALIRAKLQHLSLVPFASYQAGSELNAFANAISKIAVAVPLGLFAAWTIGPRGLPPLMASWTVLATAFFAIVEIGQLFVPSRVPDPADVMVGVAASLGGLFLGRWLQRHR